MNDILIIPDIHGRDFWKEPCKNWKGKVVFLGDYVDPYPEEKISLEDSILNFINILDYTEENKNCILLLGNHDIPYIYPNNLYYVTRHNKIKEKEIQSLFSEAIFKYIYIEDKYLFSHAGVDSRWLCAEKLNIKSLNYKLDENPDLAWDVPYLRGGYNNFGSCIWSDIRDFKNDLSYYQIFGHTQLKDKPIITNTFACLDCRRPFILKDNKIIEFKNN
jgi:predicted MPP superfamily phosphohydrolase